MKTTVFGSIAAVLASALPAIAASGAREDNSGFFVWGFLGICALIIVAQMLPAVMVMLGFAKGVRKQETAKQTTTH